MENISLVIMEKEKDTGFLSRELGSYEVKYDTEYVSSIYASREDENLYVNMYLTVPGEFEDWKYNAILDNYDTGLYKDKALLAEEDEDSYNPGWVIKFLFLENDNEMEEKINELLGIHVSELERVLSQLKNIEDEYRD
ncbi:MAG: hypothetical protein G4V63_04065 [Candidatus Afipia apatlaquensis]|uniref:Uncharacterized protein n=1 Tax=Candidatus Afipia apatlaquensis TaxID=2712852 RepID=A0A7C9RCZ8_9BRAD|nr:hypothetical protein [Candidatus Afipia apatlaquensis]